MKKIIIWVSLALSGIYGQTGNQVHLDVVFNPYVSYYISSIDLNTGGSTVPMFTATISNDQHPTDSVWVSIEFQILVDSDALGLYNETLLRLVTDPFWLKATIILNNQVLTIDTDEIFDVEGKKVPLSVSVDEQIDMEDAEELFNTIVQSGRLPDGIYSFSVAIRNGNNEDDILAQEEEVINVSTPTYLQLISPGGILADTSLNEIFTSYPVFQWESDPCNVPGGCEIFMRVAEFDPSIHSTVEEAIESLTRLPLEQSEEFASVGFGVTTFQYPATDVGDLELGKVYAWQVKKIMETTGGTEEILSEVFAFKIKDFTTAGSGQGVVTDPVMISMQSLLGDDQFNALFGPGAPYAAYGPNGNVVLDGNTVSLSDIQTLFSQGIAEVDSLGNTSYRPLNVILVEVE